MNIEEVTSTEVGMRTEAETEEATEVEEATGKTTRKMVKEPSTGSKCLYTLISLAIPTRLRSQMRANKQRWMSIT